VSGMNTEFVRRVSDGADRSRSTKALVEAAFACRLRECRGAHSLRTSHPSYAETPADNLVPTVCERDFREDLAAGDGNELEDSGTRPAKFCAAHSSSALCVNVFGYFRHRPKLLTLPGCDNFTECQFERKLSTGISTPNLDFLASGPDQTVCLESKCTEPLSEKTAKFSPRYQAVVEALAEPCWRSLYESVLDDPGLFSRLDVAQLIRHYLGIRCSLSSEKRTNRLIYAYWQPLDWNRFPEFSEHAAEVERFTRAIQDSTVRFQLVTYSTLFRDWLRRETLPSQVRRHVELVRDRYEFELGND